MLALTVDGYTLAALALIVAAVLVLAAIAARLFRDHGVRVVRIGVFIDRRRVVEPDRDEPGDGDERWPRQDA